MSSPAKRNPRDLLAAVAKVPPTERKHRAWTDADTNTVMQAILDFRAHTGGVPHASTMPAFFDTIKASLPGQVTADHMDSKIKRFRSDFNKLADAPGPHGTKFYKLGYKLWGEKHSRGQKSRPAVVEAGTEVITKKDDKHSSRKKARAETDTEEITEKDNKHSRRKKALSEKHDGTEEIYEKDDKHSRRKKISFEKDETDIEENLEKGDKRNGRKDRPQKNETGTEEIIEMDDKHKKQKKHKRQKKAHLPVVEKKARPEKDETGTEEILEKDDNHSRQKKGRTDTDTEEIVETDDNHNRPKDRSEKDKAGTEKIIEKDDNHNNRKKDDNHNNRKKAPSSVIEKDETFTEGNGVSEAASSRRKKARPSIMEKDEPATEENENTVSVVAGSKRKKARSALVETGSKEIAEKDEAVAKENGVLEAVDGGNGGSEACGVSCPVLRHGLVKYFREEGLMEEMIDFGLKVADPEKVRVLEGKWRQQHIKNIQLEMKRCELNKSLLRLLVESYKHMSS